MLSPREIDVKSIELLTTWSDGRVASVWLESYCSVLQVRETMPTFRTTSGLALRHPPPFTAKQQCKEMVKRQRHHREHEINLR